MSIKEPKQSGFAVGLKLLLALPDNSPITSDMLLKGHKRDMTSAAAYNVLWKLEKHGGTKRAPTKRGVFRTIKSGLLQYASDHGTKHRLKPLGSTTKAPRRKSVKHGAATPVSQSIGAKDMDIIEELLDVMARAEPVLRRLREQDEVIRGMAERLGLS